ncbi:MAG: signal peptidase I [Ruminococcus sp.]
MAFILLRYVFLIGYVPTESMEPTLPKGSFLLGLRIFEEPKVGDIIVFEKDGALLVKRIAAGPGDQVDLSQLTYMTSLPIPVWKETIITVPEGCYFVLGDNTQNSWDSRYWQDPYLKGKDIIAIVRT